MVVSCNEETYTVFAQHLLATKATGSSAAQAAGTDSSYLTGTTSFLRYFQFPLKVCSDFIILFCY